MHPTGSLPAGSTDQDSREAEVRRLILQVQSGLGREQAFEVIHKRYHAPLQRFFFKHSRSRSATEELTQETFLRVFKNIDSFRADRRFDSWLFEIAANVWRNQLRRLHSVKREGTVNSLDGIEALQDSLASPAPGPLHDSLERERWQAFRTALDSLPTQMRRATMLRLATGLRYREIARVMELSVETVKAHLYQAKARLKAALAEHFSDFDL
jgi:RNA polymerase sigma-70 factor (ECF subfamily)